MEGAAIVMRGRAARISIVVGAITACLLAAPASAQDLDWERPADRELIDRSFRNFAKQCGSFGFVELTPLTPEEMQNRMYARLLLLPAEQAKLQVARWSRWLMAMIALGKADEGPTTEGTERAGAAITAAVIDPSTHEEAKRRYVTASAGSFRPMLTACTSAAADPFVGTNFVSGAGSLKVIEEYFARQFDQSVGELRAERQAASK